VGSRNLLVYALNLILTTETDMWALRYPDTNGLFVLEWAPDVTRERRRLNIAGSVGGVRVRFEDPAEAPAVVVASQRMNNNPGWRLMRCGELLHVDEKLDVTSTIVMDEPPVQLLTPAGPRPSIRCFPISLLRQLGYTVFYTTARGQRDQ
jgi:glutamine amidotransferase